MRINTKLENEFNLQPMSLANPNTAEGNNELDIISEKNLSVEEKNQIIDKIELALPQVYGLEAADRELDELADYAIAAHKDLLDLAMNVEQRFVGEIAGAASNMLGHALTARTNKLKKKLDMIGLQIKKQIADNKVKSNDTAEPIDGAVTLMDRNEMLAHLLGTKKK